MTDPVEVKIVSGNFSPGFTSKPTVMWVKVSGATPDDRERVARIAYEAAKSVATPSEDDSVR